MPGTNLTLRDIQIMQKVEIEGKPWDDVAEELDISRVTIARTKNKPAYRDAVLAILEKRGKEPAELFAVKLMDKLEAKKTVRVFNEENQQIPVEVDDNVAQVNAMNRLGDMLGVDAPKEFDLKHSMAAMSDDELQRAIKESAEALNGRVQHRIAGSYHAQDIIANTIADTESAMAERPSEPAVGPANP